MIYSLMAFSIRPVALSFFAFSIITVFAGCACGIYRKLILWNLPQTYFVGITASFAVEITANFAVDEFILLCYCISKVAKGLFFLREKSGNMACGSRNSPKARQRRPAECVTADRAGIKQTAHIVGGSACVQGLHYHALSANREIITQPRIRRHILSVSR